jgi:hypothetical protein
LRLFSDLKVVPIYGIAVGHTTLLSATNADLYIGNKGLPHWVGVAPFAGLGNMRNLRRGQQIHRTISIAGRAGTDTVVSDRLCNDAVCEYTGVGVWLHS